MKGFFHKALIIDLTNKAYHVEPIPDEVFENYLGGKGLGVYFLLKRCRPGTDPFSPENPFIVTLGPINDTNIWGSSRYGVFTRSPLTNIFSESYSGGRVAEPISRTGHDAIILEGASTSPVFLEIDEETVLFHDASDIWGSDSYQAQDLITKKVNRKDTGVLVIGPAGENLVRFASVVNNYWRCAGRTGVGAVLGSKKVKGLAFHGAQKREVAQRDAIKGFRNEWTKKGKVHPYAQGYKVSGTPGLVSGINKFEAFPTRYWAEGVMEGWENISAETLHAKFSVKRRACSRCFLACGRLTTVTEGKYKGLTIDGPEYETIYAIGGLCLIKDLGEIIYLNDICDRLGIDTITAGNLAAFTIEASQRGRTNEKLSYGDAEGIASLFRRIARKEGIGGILAEGVRHAAKEWGLEDLAIHVKGMEPGGYDPRIFKGMGLAYATSDRGGCHIRSTFFRAEASGMIPADQIEGKAEMFLDFEDRLIIHDALIMCRFYRDLYRWNELLQMVAMTTGMDLTEDQLRRIASNIQTATRIFNMREGITRADDTLPKRFFEEPIGSKKSIITREDLERLKDDYYRLRGWNENGFPLKLPPCID